MPPKKDQNQQEATDDNAKWAGGISPGPSGAPRTSQAATPRYSLRGLRSDQQERLQQVPEADRARIARELRRRQKKEADRELRAGPSTHRTLPAPPEPIPRFQSSLVIGESLGENLSRIEAADRRVLQWQAICEYHAKYFPDALPTVQASLKEAVDERFALSKDDPENTRPVMSLPSTAEKAIAARLRVLHDAVAESVFPPERMNILAAIAGYEAGAIPASETTYTIIWAGRIVDTAESYGDFSFGGNRAERLDKYYAEHGAGWIWYEAPLLDKKPQRAAVAMCLKQQRPQPRAPGLGGHHCITMGFRRLKEHVSRGDDREDKSVLKTRPSSLSQRLRVAKRKPYYNNDKLTLANSEAPQLFFKMLLDSGATWPCLYESDLRRCGIDTENYAASTAETTHGFNDSKFSTKDYEMQVGVYHANESSLANPQQWPFEPDLLGAVIPVIAMADKSQIPEDEKWESRLSSGLPWMVLYTSSAPATGNIWMGSERGDVLGADKLPGQRRFDIEKELTPNYPADLKKTIGPLMCVTFTHATKPKKKNWTLEDVEDVNLGQATMSVYDEGGYEEKKWTIKAERKSKPPPERVQTPAGRPARVKTAPFFLDPLGQYDPSGGNKKPSITAATTKRKAATEPSVAAKKPRAN